MSFAFIAGYPPVAVWLGGSTLFCINLVLYIWCS